MKNLLRVGVIFSAAVLLTGLAYYGYLYQKWEPLMRPALPLPAYQVGSRQSDTVGVMMIGDSWAELHHENGYDSLMQRMLENHLSRPVTFVSRGKGGAKSGEVYHYLFRSRTSPSEQEQGYCTQELLEQAPDYGVVMAGINDASANMSYDTYCQNYANIIRLLLSAGCRPVVVEMPPVGLHELHAGKPWRDDCIDRVRSVMNRCRLRDVDNYGTALVDYLQREQLTDSVVMVRKTQWSREGYRDKRKLFLPDGIHLNKKGYRLMDSCIAEAIAKDVIQRKDN